MSEAKIKLKRLPSVPDYTTKSQRVDLDYDTEILLLKRASGRNKRIFQIEQSEKSKAALKESSSEGKPKLAGLKSDVAFSGPYYPLV